jgi:hypothetical protein
MAKRRSQPRPALPAVGDAFAVPLPNGLWGGCRVIRVGDDGRVTGRPNAISVQVGALAWLAAVPPTGAEPGIAKLLFVNHHNERHLALTWVAGRDPIPESFVPIAAIPPLPEDLTRFVGSGTSWARVAIEIEAQWRWNHDRDAVLREDAERLDRLAAADRAALAVRRHQVDAMTLAALRRQQPFARWKGDRPAAAITAAHRIFRSTIDQLIALGPTPTRVAAEPILRACIDQFNRLNAAHDGFIETMEREDIADHFARVVHVAGLAEYGSADLTEQWRDW